MILFIWVSIHKPHVDRDIIVNSIFIFIGKVVVFMFSREVVISKIDSITDFRYLFFISVIGRVLKNIIVPSIVINVDVLFFILVIIVFNMFVCLVRLYFSFLGFIMSIRIMFDKMFNPIMIIAILGL